MTANPELFRFLQLASGIFPGQDEACFLAHASAHFSAVRDNHLCDFIARLTERAGDDPGGPFHLRRRSVRAFSSSDFNCRPASRSFAIISRFPGSLKEIVNALRNHFAHVGNPLQFLDRGFHDRVQVWKMIGQRA